MITRGKQAYLVNEIPINPGLIVLFIMSLHQYGTPRKTENAEEELKPGHYDNNHQGSMFGNVRRSRACFVINPEWVSESVNTPRSQPLSRPPWPWEQPRHRINMQLPVTYTVMEKPTKLHPQSAIPYDGPQTKTETYYVQKAYGTPSKGLTPVERVYRS